jgi:hypothetical protein
MLATYNALWQQKGSLAQNGLIFTLAQANLNREIYMKRFVLLAFAFVLCLGMSQAVFAQHQPDLIDPERCVDCDPPPPPPCSGNPIDDPTFFVQQQYLDFLGRYPTGSELANDVAPLNSCLLAGNFACYNTARVHMSRTMWDKQEFHNQQINPIGDLLNPAFFSHTYELYNNDDFVRLDYRVYLRRNHDISGFTFWLSNLDSCVNNSTSAYSCPGCSTQCYYDSINAFLSSTEYRDRFACQ